MTPPTNLTTTLLNSRAITLSWEAAQSATRYLIWYSLDGRRWRALTQTSATSYTLSGAGSSHNNAIFENLAQDRKLRFRVFSCNSTTFVLSHEYAYLEVTVPEFELEPPSNLTVALIGTGGVKMTWTATPYTTRQYILQYRVNDGAWSGSGSTWTPTANSTSGTFPDSNYLMSLTPNAKYEFRMKTCISTTGTELGKSSPWCYSEPARTPEQCELAAPTNLAKTGSSPSYTWTWDVVPNATHYYISGYAFTGSGGSLPTQLVTKNTYTSSSSYTGTRYTVTAMNKTTLQRSETSQNFISDVTLPAVPMSATFKTATAVGLNVNHATYLSYGSHVLVDYKKAEDSEWIPVTRIGSSASTSPTWVDGLEPGTDYQFRGRYVNFQNEMPAPTILNLTTHPSEFAKGYYSKGSTTGFVAAKVSKGLVEFYRSADGVSFAKISELEIEKATFHFDKATNMIYVGGVNVLYFSSDSVNWTRLPACGVIRNIQYDAANAKYVFIDDNARLFFATQTQLESMSILGPFVPTNIAATHVNYGIYDMDELAFAMTSNQTYVIEA